ncbi:hypothetical protein AXG93_1157s1000 [Marchantia polymorpha subsp. ruderalis]|uniref:Protein kinase domain-containing protein n=1 Tax=Marchantia polymorpha subsp. ruderalis TaxID=1480154 RepID=A0A176VZD9_MARPO|nr:hypothetical protein AXG93_1157s1000 [Marchantia polymorpha subsp. ruderalis]
MIRVTNRDRLTASPDRGQAYVYDLMGSSYPVCNLALVNAGSEFPTYAVLQKVLLTEWCQAAKTARKDAGTDPGVKWSGVEKRERFHSRTGFISISCGGVSGVDPVTSLDWITDESHLDSYKSLFDGNVITTADVQYNESSPSVPNDEQLKTALVFLPNQMTRSKFCYNLPIAFNATEGSRNYLLRAMFPSQNLTVNGKALSGYATRFYLTVDSTYITTIQLLPSIPQTIELVVSSLDDKFYVCLVPLEDKSSMPAISTLELRPFNPDTYDRSGQSKEKQQSSYLMLVDRYDFGGILDTESPPLRFPADPFDRIWSSPRIPEGAQFEAYNRTEDANLGYGGDNVRFPIAVMRSIWRGKNLSSTMNFEVNVKSARAHRPLPTFWFQILCSNVVSGDVNPHQSVRLIDGDLAGGWGPFEVPGSPNFIQLLSNDLLIRSDSFTIRIEPNETTEAPVLVNAAEIHGEFAAVAVRTSKLDVDAVQRFSTNLVSNSLDTAGDPCLPIPWDWLVCSIELPPTITQINLTTKAVLGELDLEVSLLSRLTVLDLSNNHFNGRVPLTLVNVSTLRALDFSRNNFSGQIPPFPADSFMNLEYINLRDNAFIGPIPAEIVKFENLESLDLSGNNLSQGLPTELGKLQSLKTLNMENNNFTELNLTSWYYLVRGKKELNTSSVQRVRLMGNPISIVHIPSDDALDDLIRPSQTSGQLSEQNKDSGNRTLLIVAITVGVGALVSAAILLFFLRNSWKRIQNLQQIQDALAKLDVRPPFYKYEELKAATNEFSKNNELGRGAFGAVYKMGRFLLLNGCSSRPRVLNWDQRKKIAVGIARGLSYLHEELQPKIIHRDIKPQNILLDKYLNAKIADFGLARPADEDKTQLATHVGGTRGYFSPEYATLGMFTEKLDVYSFGILLLEIVAGRPCLRSVSSTLSEEEMYLRVWASDLLRRDKLMDMVDHDLVGNCSQEEVVATLKIALSCVQQEAKDRPYMSQVVSMLTGLAALPF